MRHLRVHRVTARKRSLYHFEHLHANFGGVRWLDLACFVLIFPLRLQSSRREARKLLTQTAWDWLTRECALLLRTALTPLLRSNHRESGGQRQCYRIRTISKAL